MKSFLTHAIQSCGAQDPFADNTLSTLLRLYRDKNMNHMSGLRQYAVICVRIHQTTVLTISLALFTFNTGIYVLNRSEIFKALL